MPPPITHTFFAHRLYRKQLPGANLRSLVVGTNFPDIRNLSGHPRSHTHDTDIGAADVLEPDDAFRVGFLLHSYVDALHWRVIEDAGATAAYYDDDRIVSVAWKIVADEMLFTEVPDRETVISFFDDVLEDEAAFGIEDPLIEQWHQRLKRYLGVVPSPRNTQARIAALGIKSLGVPNDRAAAIADHVARFREDEDLKEHVDEVIRRFDRELAAT